MAASTARDDWRAAAAVLRRIDCGEILVQLPGGRGVAISGSRGGEPVHIRIHSWKCLLRLLAHGDLGFAEGYLAGEWSTPNMHAFLNAAAPRSPHEASFERLKPPQPLTWLRHALLNRNTRRGSRRNIRAHYDLGNDFYRLWLDPSMTYSSGIYALPRQTLAQAQQTKLDRITELLDLDGGERVLEIGCGWGALARHLIERHRCHVTGLTLSTEQLGYAREQLAAHRLADRSDLRLEDYRDTEGSYDRVVSIEMLEAVGEAYWPLFFDKLRERLNVGGIAVLQVITIDERRFDNYRRRPEFIQRHIFPAGCCRPSASSGGWWAIPDCGWLRPSSSPTAMHERWPIGTTVSSTPGRRSKPSASISGSSECGSTIWPIAGWALKSAPSMWGCTRSNDHPELNPHRGSSAA
jgi:cyclopropane-fatty-acyl-phospholipid synthase